MSVEKAYAAAIDSLVSASVRPNRPHASPEELSALHDAAARTVAEPMPHAAARHISTSVQRDAPVFFLTGVYDPVTLPFGETDGPPGVAVLARAVDMGLGAKPIVLCEEQIMESIELSCISVGLLPVRNWEHAQKKLHSVLLLPFPIDGPEESRADALRLIETYHPSAVVSIERKGRNVKGRYHNAVGQSRATEACLDYVVDAATAAGIATVGVGDGGNEIGMGNIREDVKAILPYGRRCQCDCEAGIAPVVETDVLVVANTSNLGAYGIVASMAILLDQPGLIHDRKTEGRLLDAVAAARCMDSGLVAPSVDGTGDTSMAIVELLGKLARFACG